MGLFGGFKAKFTKDSTAKGATKQSKKEEVVCLGYRVYSEFDEFPQPSQESKTVVTTKTTRPTNVRTVFPKTEASTSVPTQPIETLIVTNPNVKKSKKKKQKENSDATQGVVRVDTKTKLKRSKEVQKVVPADNTTHANNGKISTNSESSLTPLRSTGDVSRSVPNSFYVEDKTNSFNPSPSSTKKIPPKSILKSKSLTEMDEVSNEQQSFETEVVQYSKTSQQSGKYMTQISTVLETPSATTKSAAIVATKTTSNSISTGVYTYSQNTKIGSTSSHAANIFFGGDDDDEEDQSAAARSSADC